MFQIAVVRIHLRFKNESKMAKKFTLWSSNVPTFKFYKYFSVLNFYKLLPKLCGRRVYANLFISLWLLQLKITIDEPHKTVIRCLATVTNVCQRSYYAFKWNIFYFLLLLHRRKCRTAAYRGNQEATTGDAGTKESTKCSWKLFYKAHLSVMWCRCVCNVQIATGYPLN